MWLPTFISGIHACVVALLAQKAEIKYDCNITNAEKIVSYIKDLGFDSSIIEDDAAGHAKVELQVHFGGLVYCVVFYLESVGLLLVFWNMFSQPQNCSMKACPDGEGFIKTWFFCHLYEN